MIIKRLVLEDFQIFYGRQQLDLGAGLYVIHGENGRGKSTLLSAVHWALFGHYENRQGNVVSSRVMVNRDAVREGRTTVKVELLLEDGGEEILIRRSYDGSDPDSGVRLYVERAGRTLDEHSAGVLLRNMLDEEAARFFLFDGEELRAYEELLLEDETSAEAVRGSIEQILGLPALTNAVEDLEQVVETFDSEVTKAGRRESKTQRAAMRAQQLEKERDDARDDLSELGERRAAAEAAVAEASAVLQEFDSSRELVLQTTAVEEEVKRLREQRDLEAERRERALGETWRDVLDAAVADRRAEIRAELDARSERERDAATVGALRASLDAGVCSQCEETLPDGARTRIAGRIATLEDGRSPDGGEADLRDAWLSLSSIGPAGRIGDAVDSDRRIGQIEADVVAKQQELADLRERTGKVPRADIRAASKRRDEAQRTIGEIDVLARALDRKIADLTSDLRKSRDEIEKASSSEEVAAIRRRHVLATEVQEIFASAKDEFRDALRVQVERDASAIFARLTATPAYEGLRINASYGLETLGPDGQPVPGRSAGQEQIVALALIGALNRNASRRAPVMMDTPLARLDQSHREKVLAFLGEMAEQVFLLVHSAEVSDDDLDRIRGSIAAEYRLEEEALFRTEIRQVTA